MRDHAPIGIFGGTFDPVHFGHLRLAQEALEQCKLSAVRFIPGGTPPHRASPHANPQQRLEMVRLALQGHEKFILDEREIFRTDPCYTVHTLIDLRKELAEQQALCLLLGSDAFLQLHTWHQWEELFRLAHIVVLQRPGYDLQQQLAQAPDALQRRYHAHVQDSPAALLAAPAGTILTIDIPALNISSSDIRMRCTQQKDVHSLLPDAVRTYIHSHKLYNYARH